jgi:hypothetical protein
MFLPLALLALTVAPQAADTTLPPATVRAKFTVDGVGIQVYNCTLSNGNYAWTFIEPAATLFDPATKQKVGTHSAGPTWTWNDLSSITGKVLQKQPAANPKDIPSLLLETRSTGDANGALANIVMVRRSNAQAGQAPADGCDAQHVDVVLRVPYEATYTFYEAVH